MSSTLRTVLIVLLALALGAALFFAGMFFAGARYGFGAYGPYGMMGYRQPYGYGMMGAGGMMGGSGYGGLNKAQPLSVEDARKAVESYLGTLGNDDLAIKDIMIFDNGAYAAVEEKSTGIGAFELLVDPLNLSVFPEYGPNMMWNLKYGMASGTNGYGRGMMNGMMGGMMGGWYGNSQGSGAASADMPVSAAQASRTAQAYLDANLPGLKVSDEITPFYGYYTIDLERDGQIAGMLSVNGYSGQVFLHTWHGNFVEQSEE